MRRGGQGSFQNEIREGYRLARVAQGNAAESSGRATRMRVKNTSDFGDYIVCRTWNGTTEGTKDILVALPYLLQRTPFHGQTRNGVTYGYITNRRRTANNGTEVLTEGVTPSYVLSDEIWAVLAGSGGSGVVEEGTGKPARWLDKNRDGRAWAIEEE